ncbi:MAG: GntR family transcriptional regulator [Cellvibrio sp.]
MAKKPLVPMRPTSKEISFDRPAAGQILEFLRDAIVAMELLPGQMISETALAQQFGVSRTPVREALIQLSNIEFVEVLPQRGTYVTKLSMDKILQSRFIREALEVAVVSHLANQAETSVRDDCIKAATEIIEQQRVAAKEDDVNRFQQLDDAFHSTLSNFTQFPRVSSLIEAEKSHMDRVRNLSLHISGQYNKVIDQHVAIVSAISAGDSNAAVAAMSLHLKDVFNVLDVIPQQHPEYFAQSI